MCSVFTLVAKSVGARILRVIKYLLAQVSGQLPVEVEEADTMEKVIYLTRFLVYSSGMITVNVQQAKTHLSEYLARVEAGETVILCRRNAPVAEIRTLRPRSSQPRPIGLARGLFQVPATFFEPLPEDVTAGFQDPAP